MIKSTGNLSEGPINILVYGESGAGKTRSLATLNNDSTLIISAESGLLSLSKFKIDFVDITVDDNNKPISSEERLTKVKTIYSYLLKPETMQKYDTIAMDSITEIGQCVVETYNKKIPDRKDSYVMWQEYNKTITALIKSFRDLPHYNKVFTCLSKTEKDQNNARYQAFDIGGSISNRLPQFFDEVFYIHCAKDEEGNFKRYFQTQKENGFYCKDRSDKLNFYEKIDFQEIFEKIRS